MVMFTLEVEGKDPREVTSYATVERSLRSLKPYGPRTYAILDRGDDHFVQVAGGQVSAAVEYRSPDGLWRAYLTDPHRNYSAPVTKHFGAGTIIVQPDEVLWLEDVVAVFRVFFEGNGEWPVGWRAVDL